MIATSHTVQLVKKILNTQDLNSAGDEIRELALIAWNAMNNPPLEVLRSKHGITLTMEQWQYVLTSKMAGLIPGIKALREVGGEHNGQWRIGLKQAKDAVQDNDCFPVISSR